MKRTAILTAGGDTPALNGTIHGAIVRSNQLHVEIFGLMKPSRKGIDCLLPIFTDAIGEDDSEHMRRTLFASGNLAQPYHSINIDIHKRIRHLEEEAA